MSGRTPDEAAPCAADESPRQAAERVAWERFDLDPEESEGLVFVQSGGGAVRRFTYRVVSVPRLEIAEGSL